MKKLNMILLALVGFGLIGCTTGHPMGDKDEAWFIDQSPLSADVYYCKANKTEKGAVPICFKANMMSPRP